MSFIVLLSNAFTSLAICAGVCPAASRKRAKSDMSFSSFVPFNGNNARPMEYLEAYLSYNCKLHRCPVSSISYNKVICSKRSDNFFINSSGRQAVSLFRQKAGICMAASVSTSFSPPVITTKGALPGR